MGEIQLQDKRVLYYTDTNEILFNDTSLRSDCIVCWEMDDPAGSN